MDMVDAIIYPVMIVDYNYRITQANKTMAEHSGIDVKEIKNMDYYEVFSKRDSPCENC